MTREVKSGVSPAVLALSFFSHLQFNEDGGR